jgi:hypothetical protein
MNTEYEIIVDAAWQAVAQKRAAIEKLVDELWEIKYKTKYRQRRGGPVLQERTPGGDWLAMVDSIKIE